MTKHPIFQGFTLRSAVVEGPGAGWILAADLALAKQDRAHTAIFRLQNGTFRRIDVDFSAHSGCLIRSPEPGFAAISGIGRYVVESARGVVQGNIFSDSAPPPTRPRYGDFRGVAEIDGKAHAVGLRGMAYRLDSLRGWTRVDEGLAEKFNAEAVHGFGVSDVYVAGYRGQLWHYDGTFWRQIDLPTNVVLNAIRCAPNGTVYIGGKRGVLLQGRGDTWSVLALDNFDESIWGLAWFAEELYVSTMKGLYVVRHGTLVPVPLDADGTPVSTYQLSAAAGVLWSIGEYDLLAFDGNAWTRVV